MALTDGLEAFWKFDGDAVDSQGSHTGIANGKVEFRPGVDGQAAAPENFNIDGNEASIEIEPIILEDDWTIAVRFVPRGEWDGQHRLFSESSTGKGLYLDDNSGDRGLGFYDALENDHSAIGAFGLPAIHHAAARFIKAGGGQLTLWANGEIVFDDTIGSSAGAMFIDRVAFDGFGWSLVLADNAAIYSRALAPDEIVELIEWGGPGSGGGDVTPPSIAVVSPVPGSSIGPTAPLVVEVTDNDELRLTLLTARVGDADEVVHDGQAFTYRYAASSRTEISGGYRYVVRRTGGWPSGPTLNVFAIDVSGQEA